MKREKENQMNYIASKKYQREKITKKELENIFNTYKLGVEAEDLDKMVNYMVNNNESEQNDEAEENEEDEDEEEIKISTNKKKKKINSVTREQFKKFYTEKK